MSRKQTQLGFSVQNRTLTSTTSGETKHKQYNEINMSAIKYKNKIKQNNMFSSSSGFTFREEGV